MPPLSFQGYLALFSLSGVIGMKMLFGQGCYLLRGRVWVRGREPSSPRTLHGNDWEKPQMLLVSWLVLPGKQSKWFCRAGLVFETEGKQELSPVLPPGLKVQSPSFPPPLLLWPSQKQPENTNLASNSFSPPPHPIYFLPLGG